MKMTKDEFQILLDKYLHGLASPDDKKLLDQFFDSYKMTSGTVHEFHDDIKEEIFQNVQTRTGSNGRRVRRVRFTLSPWARVAAVISFALITSYLLFYQFGLREKTTPSLIAKLKEVHASKGQKLDIRLPDGSRVKLNANSKIVYPEKFGNEAREITLEGEAYFEVTHMPSLP